MSGDCEISGDTRGCQSRSYNRVCTHEADSMWQRLWRSLQRASHHWLSKAPASGSQGPSLRVLVVDGSKADRQFLRRVVSYLGHQVSTADGGAQALEELRKQPFDVVLLDLDMPGVTGLEVLRYLPDNYPVIAVSAGVATERVEEAMRAGAADVLKKPVRAETLQEYLRCLSSTRLPAVGSRPASTQLCVLDELRAWDTRESISTWLGHLLNQCTTGLSAFEGFMLRGDLASAADCVHSLRTSVAHIGLANSVRVTQEIETALRSGVAPDETLRTLRAVVDYACGFIRAQPEYVPQGHADPAATPPPGNG